MKFIPLRGKKPILKANSFWSGMPLNGQDAIGLVNGTDGRICLDIDHVDCETYLKHLRFHFPNHSFGIVRTQSGKYHIYFRYLGLIHKSVKFLITHDGNHFGELRCNRHQVFPSDHPQYTWSHRYTLVQDLNDLPTLDDQDIDCLMKYLGITFRSKPATETVAKTSTETSTRETCISNDSATLCVLDMSVKSYLPTCYDTNYPMMFALLKALYRAGRYQECDTYFQQWLDLNCFKKHTDDSYYWGKWEGMKKTFNPAKLRPFERYQDLVASALAEAISQGLKSRQKRVTHAIKHLIPRIKDEYGYFHLGSHSAFFTANGVHAEEVLRAMRSLAKDKKIALVDKGWIGESSRKANTYRIEGLWETQSSNIPSSDTLGSSQDAPGSIENPGGDDSASVIP